MFQQQSYGYAGNLYVKIYRIQWVSFIKKTIKNYGTYLYTSPFLMFLKRNNGQYRICQILFMVMVFIAQRE